MQEITLELPDDVLDSCNERIQGTEFESQEKYLSFVIKEVVELNDVREPKDYEPSESERIDNLESLGYI